MVRKADFGSEQATSFMLRAKGTGTLEIRLDKVSAKPAAQLEFSSTSFADHTLTLDTAAFTGVHNVYFLFTQAKNVMFDAWQFSNEATAGIPSAQHRSDRSDGMFDMQGRQLTGTKAQRGVVIEAYTGADGKRRAVKKYMK